MARPAENIGDRARIAAVFRHIVAADETNRRQWAADHGVSWYAVRRAATDARDISYRTAVKLSAAAGLTPVGLLLVGHGKDEQLLDLVEAGEIAPDVGEQLRLALIAVGPPNAREA